MGFEKGLNRGVFGVSSTDAPINTVLRQEIYIPFTVFGKDQSITRLIH